MIELLSSGMLSTIQDNGRPAYQRFGVPVAGAMDKFSYNLANVLVGHRKPKEVIEATVIGPTIKFQTANIFAICGGDFTPTLDGQPIENNHAYLAEAGSILKLGTAVRGCRCYIAFAGGLDIEKVMGSRSTYLKGKIGGLDGRALRAGDTIQFRSPAVSLPNMAFRYFGHDFWLEHFDDNRIRVIEGPQADYFSAQGIDTFLGSEYTVAPENDRMGYRLSGPAIAHNESQNGDIISDGIPLGAIQVPKDQPIIMMADRQTTGGYTKIASVLSVDLPYVAQLKTGDKIHFELTDIATAQQLYIKRMQFIRGLYHQLNDNEIRQNHIYSISLHSKHFNVSLTEI